MADMTIKPATDRITFRITVAEDGILIASTPYDNQSRELDPRSPNERRIDETIEKV